MTTATTANFSLEIVTFFVVTSAHQSNARKGRARFEEPLVLYWEVWAMGVASS